MSNIQDNNTSEISSNNKVSKNTNVQNQALAKNTVQTTNEQNTGTSTNQILGDTSDKTIGVYKTNVDNVDQNTEVVTNNTSQTLDEQNTGASTLNNDDKALEDSGNNQDSVSNNANLNMDQFKEESEDVVNVIVKAPKIIIDKVKESVSSETVQQTESKTSNLIYINNTNVKIAGDLSYQNTDVNKTNVDNTAQTTNEQNTGASINQILGDTSDKNTKLDKDNVNNADQTSVVAPKSFFKKVSSMPYNAASATIGVASSAFNTVNNAGINYIGNPIYNTAAAVGNGVKNVAVATGNGAKKVVTAPFTLISSVIWKSENAIQENTNQK